MKHTFNFATPVAYKPYAKVAFHKAGRAKLRALAQALFLPKECYDLRSNQGGIAVSGEITLHTDSIYVQISQSALGGGMGILIRTCKGRKDYTGGRNHWLSLSALDDIPRLAHYVRRVLEESN
jgi:hypothetical protein